MRCHARSGITDTGACEILLIGAPNVGKSVIFNRLTGMDVSVANYAGTTVEFARGIGRIGEFEATLVDVPGTYTLSATNEAERVAIEMLSRPVDLVIAVADAVNLESSVYLVLQVLARQQPTVVVLNRIDVAAARGIAVDAAELSRLLGVAVAPTVAVTGQGFAQLHQLVAQTLRKPAPAEGSAAAGTLHTAATTETAGLWPLAEEIAQAVHTAPAVSQTARRRRVSLRRGSRRRFDSEALVRPWPGLVVAVLVLALAFGLIVGLGMGMRQLLLLPIARGYLFPLLTAAVTRAIGPGLFQNILIGEYGLLIKGIEWPFTLVLPYVLSFYLAISLLEDSGYLPRFAVLLDGLLSKIGLRGSHSISLLLGYGCAIPGILSTRAMGSRRERLIVATLISLAVPCISQTGALFALLAESSVWLVAALFGLSFLVMIIAGLITDRLLPGERSQLVFELPELLMPRPAVMLQKLLARARNYLTDGALPMVAAVGVAALLYESGLLAQIGVLLAPLVTGWLRLPQQAAVPLLLGVVRRELTVLPLLDMPLTQLQLFVGATVGLFYVPCIAVVATLGREFGVRTAIGMLLLTTGTAFLLGGAIAQIGALL
ncbi:MAG: ferrous iron transporter B [Spirochaetaceae bacterium]|nr:MAG: ferrous iron transporter B [Spirochaetaceae bacterium]